MRAGTSPHGRELGLEFMAWKAYARFSDDELKALWIFLQSLPPVESGTISRFGACSLNKISSLYLSRN